MGEEPLFKRGLNVLNDLLHHPAFEDITWYIHWAIVFALAPLLIIAVAIVFVYDYLAGNIGSGRHHSPEGKPVLITGCDSGFGHELALLLSSQGWKVYAGCLTQAGQDSLKSKGNQYLIPVEMVSLYNTILPDITDEEI